jgi:hypothetical protein
MVNPDGAAAVARIKQGLRGRRAARRPRGKVVDLSEQNTDRAFHDLGPARRGWFAISKRIPDHRNRMTKFLEHFKVDPDRSAVRAADH